MTTAPDIFLSYNREDQARAKLFAEAFEAQGFKVWWDVGLRTGEAYDEVTETALRMAKAVVVLWSKKSVQSRWVRAEATLADRNKTLVPCMIEPCERPIMFELTQTAELAHWQGEKSDAVWLGFLGDVARFVGRERAPGPAAPTLVSTSAMAQAQPGPRGARPSVAILPFTNRSTERADEVFAGGMGEDIAAALSLGRGLKVISQSATFAYRKNTSDLRTIGQELGAKYVLEGNTRRVGQTLRVTAQLVEAETGAILWTQKFDRPLSELAELQEELVEELATHLGVQIQKVEMERALKKPGDITAWEAVMRSWAVYTRSVGPNALPTAVAEARRAVALGPDYAFAHATLGMALALTYRDEGVADEAPLIRETLDHAQKALALAPSDAQVLALSSVALHSIGRFADALRSAEAAVRANPNNPSAHKCLACTLIHFNKLDEAFSAFDEALRLTPRGGLQFSTLAERAAASYAAGKLDEALTTSHKALSLNANHMQCLQNMASLCMVMGRPAEAQDAVRRLRVMLPGRTLDWHLIRIRRCFYPPHLHDAWCANFAAAWSATPEDAS